MKPMPKLNKKGTYTEFPGVTVVAPTSTNNLQFWEAIYNFLNQNELVTEHYSLLPHASYHMTTHNLYTKEHTPTPHGWNKFIDDNLAFFETLQNQISTLLDFSPEITISGHIITDNVIQLVVEVPEMQHEKINNLAEFFNIQHLMPPVFHVTLAYQYKELDQISKNKIALDLSNQISALLPLTPPLHMYPPALTYFNDMTQFIPWDGTFNPFTQSFDKDNRFFSINNTNGPKLDVPTPLEDPSKKL